MSLRPFSRRGKAACVAMALAAGCALTGACTSGPVATPPVTVTVAPSTPSSSTTTTESAAQVFERIRSGVVRVQSAGCPSVGSGTGFFVADNLVVTAAHVVQQAFAISVRSDDGTGRASLVGVDWDRDVALLRVETPRDGPAVRGTVLTWATTPPQVTDPVAVLGYPKGQPLSRTEGQVSALDRTADIGGGGDGGGARTMQGLLQYTAPTVGGNSGGPVVDPRGDVVGIVDAGDSSNNSDNYAIPASTITGLVDSWTASPQDTVPDPSCDRTHYGIVTIASVHPEARALALAIDGLLAGINEADPQSAASWVTASSSLTEWDDVHYSGVVLERANLADRTHDTADVGYDAAPVDPADTRGCLHHEVEFTLSIDNGFWQVASERDLLPPVACTGTPTAGPTDPSAPTFPVAVGGGAG